MESSPDRRDAHALQPGDEIGAVRGAWAHGGHLAVLGVLLSALSIARANGSAARGATLRDAGRSRINRSRKGVAVRRPRSIAVCAHRARGAFCSGFRSRASGGAPFAVLAFLACVLGQGLFLNMVTKSQQLAVQLSALSAILPSFLLSVSFPSKHAVVARARRVDRPSSLRDHLSSRCSARRKGVSSCGRTISRSSPSPS